MMDLQMLLDGPAAAIVLGGTVLGTLLRCGPGNCLTALGALLRRRFNTDRARAELAAQIQEIRKDGILRTPAHEFGDREFDDVSATLVERRSISALLDRHQAHSQRRLLRSEAAAGTWHNASELAPVFGLAGTLVSLSQLPMQGGTGADLAASIPMAIVTTLYGLLAANLLFSPLAQWIRRRTETEEAARDELVEWLAAQVAPSISPRKSVPARPAATHGESAAA